MVDSDFLLGKTSTPINIDKYKIQANCPDNYYSSIHTLPEEELNTQTDDEEKKRVSPECRQNLMNKIISNQHPSNNSIYKKQIIDSCSSSGISGSQSSINDSTVNNLPVFDDKTTSTHCLSTPNVSLLTTDSREIQPGHSMPILCHVAEQSET